jgi:serine protease AprX
MKKRCLILFVIVGILLFFGQVNAQVEKIGANLREEMSKREPDELIPIVINLSPQPDIENLKRVAQEMEKPHRRTYVTSQLKSLATESQQDILTQLKNRESESKVKNIKSIWLANVIAAEVENQLINDITNIEAVNLIFLEHESFAHHDAAWHVKRVRADTVWQSFGYTGEGIIISVHDSGIYYHHSDLHSNIWNNLGEDYDEDGHTLEFDGQDWVLDPGDINYEDDDGNGYEDDLIGWDFKDGDNNPWYDRDHGTHVAGIIAGDGTAGTQTGVAPNAILMCLKTTKSGNAYPSDFWISLQYALDNGADIANFSIGLAMCQPETYEADRATFRQVFEAAVAAGLTICAVAGSDFYAGPPNGIRLPGSVPPVITVGGTDFDDNIASWSIPGPIAWYNLCKPADEWGDSVCYNDYPYPPGLLKPDVSAPGENITSTWTYDSSYTQLSGTSMAAPAVSGAAALLLEAYPDFTPEIVKYVLEKSSIDLGPAGKDSLYGSGRIDVYGAINSYKTGTITSDETWSNWAWVTGDVIIPSGVTVTIEPGTRVEFATKDNQNSGEDSQKCELIVYGTLDAVGSSSPGDSVMFTSDASFPTKGDWYGIRFKNASSEDSRIDFCKIKYANQGVACYRCSTFIQRSWISQCNYGCYVDTAATKLGIHDVLIDSCSYGVRINEGAAWLYFSDLVDNSVGVGYFAAGHYFKGGLAREADVNNCDIQYNSIGILCDDSSPIINYCDITDNTLWGIKCIDDSDPIIGRNDITDNGESSKFLGTKDGPPQYYDGGLFCSGTSCPIVCDGAVTGDYERGWNTIIDNEGVGIYCGGSSDPQLGKAQFPNLCPGENSLGDNDGYDVCNTTGSTIYAQANYWGEAPPDDTTEIYGSVNTFNYKSSPPSKSMESGDHAWVLLDSRDKGRGVAVLSDSGYDPKDSADEYYQLGMFYLLSSDYQEAIEAFEYMLEHFFDSPLVDEALIHLVQCYKEIDETAEMSNWLSVVASSATETELKQIALFMNISQLCREGKYSQAMNVRQALLAQDCDDEMQKSLRFREGMLYRYGLEENTPAANAFNNFIEKYPDDPLSEVARMELEIMGISASPKSSPEGSDLKILTLVPEEFVLCQNYPNPFNAQTCIQYQLPKATKVFLAIYNVLGQRVSVLADDLRPAGRYRVIWDGRDNHGLEVASGIYFTRLQAGEFAITKKMVLIR